MGLISFAAILLILGVAVEGGSDDVPFNENYEVIWGGSHVNFLNDQRDVQLWMDVYSGAGFASKQSFGSGFFEMRIKLPNRDTAGLVTAFYLRSNSSKHDELDIEFLGNKEGKPITLQTNVYVDGIGGREQRLFLWFDPSADYHSYKILWNFYQIVFYVDSIPVRVFRRHRNSRLMQFPWPTQAMKVEVSLWDGSDWATDGGQSKIDWSNAPFVAHFQGFGVAGCPFSYHSSNYGCYDPTFWWNDLKFSTLREDEQRELEHVRQTYMNYDYCADVNRHPITPPECAFNM